MEKSKFENAGDKVSKTFCILPWIHQHTWPNGNVFPCCVSKSSLPLGNTSKNTLEEIWNSDDSKELRRQLLNGEKPETCTRCFMHEEVGTMPFRVSSNNNWKHRIDQAVATTDPDGYSHDFRLNYWDFRFSNVCNFKCRMCGPELSSAWYKDQIDMFGQSNIPRALIHVNDESKKDINYYVDKFIDQVEEIYFAGGEPLMMDEHYQILEKLLKVNNTDCRVRYNTNFSRLKYKHWEVLPMWKTLHKVNPWNLRIVASLDAIGEVAEYVRTGTKWDVIEQNIKKVSDEGIKIRTSSTVGLMNVYHIPEFVDRMLELGLEPEHIEMNNILTFPDYYNMNILPDDIKKKIEDKLDNHVNELKVKFNYGVSDMFKRHYEVFKTYLHSKTERDLETVRKDFKSLVVKKDKYRQTNFVETFPYLKDWFESLETWEKDNTEKQHML